MVCNKKKNRFSFNGNGIMSFRGWQFYRSTLYILRIERERERQREICPYIQFISAYLTTNLSIYLSIYLLINRPNVLDHDFIISDINKEKEGYIFFHKYSSYLLIIVQIYLSIYLSICLSVWTWMGHRSVGAIGLDLVIIVWEFESQTCNNVYTNTFWKGANSTHSRSDYFNRTTSFSTRIARALKADMLLNQETNSNWLPICPSTYTHI